MHTDLKKKTTRVSFLACWQCDQGRATPDWACPGFRLCFRLLVLLATRGMWPSWDCSQGEHMETFKVSCILSSKLVTTGHVFIFSGKAGHMAKPTSRLGATLLLWNLQERKKEEWVTVWSIHCGITMAVCKEVYTRIFNACLYNEIPWEKNYLCSRKGSPHNIME